MVQCPGQHSSDTRLCHRRMYWGGGGGGGAAAAAFSEQSWAHTGTSWGSRVPGASDRGRFCCIVPPGMTAGSGGAVLGKEPPADSPTSCP